MAGHGLVILAQQVGAAPERDYAWLAVVIALVLIFAVGAASCMNPKRGHRD